MTRWVLVLLAIYTMGGLLGRLGLDVVVVVYGPPARGASSHRHASAV
jgi:hypothetical protein